MTYTSPWFTHKTAPLIELHYNAYFNCIRQLKYISKYQEEQMDLLHRCCAVANVIYQKHSVKLCFILLIEAEVVHEQQMERKSLKSTSAFYFVFLFCRPIQTLKNCPTLDVKHHKAYIITIRGSRSPKYISDVKNVIQISNFVTQLWAVFFQIV